MKLTRIEQFKRKKHNNWDWIYGIQKLYDKRDYNKCLRFIKEYLVEYPESLVAAQLYLKILMKLNKIEEAQEYLETNKEYICDNKFYLYRIAIFNNDYQKAYELLPEVIEEAKQYKVDYYEGVYPSKIFLEKHLNILDENIDINELSYTEQQIISYDEQKALEHIKKHQEEDENKIVHTLFEPELDLEELFYFVQNNLDSTKSYCRLITDNYIFEYPEVKNRLEKANYLYKFLHVVTIKDTENIITIYPFFLNKKIEEVIPLEEVKTKVKIPTQIEKFNNRYNKEK